MQERPMIPHYQVCAGCEKGTQRSENLRQVSGGIPEKYRVRWEACRTRRGSRRNARTSRRRRIRIAGRHRSGGKS